MARLPLLPLHCKSAPASERYHRSSHGCTVSLHMWWDGLPTQSRGTCWPMAFSSSGRHSVTGEMAGRSMTDPSAARPPSTPPNPGTHYCRASKPPLSWDQGQVQGYSVRCAWNLITLPPNVPWPLSNNPLCRHPISSPPHNLPANYTPAVRRTFRPLRRLEMTFTICASWNRGTCAFPGSCTYRHICGYGQLGHKGLSALQHRRGRNITAFG